MSSPTQHQINQLLETLADAVTELVDATMYDFLYFIECFMMGIGGRAGHQAATLPAHEAWRRRHHVTTPGPNLHPVTSVENAFRAALHYLAEADLHLEQMGGSDGNIWAERRLALQDIRQSLVRRAGSLYGIAVNV